MQPKNFLTDGQGNKVGVVLAIDEFFQLQEQLIDLALILERNPEPSVCLHSPGEDHPPQKGKTVFYDIEWKVSGIDELNKIPPDSAKKIVNDIDYLSIKPYSPHSKNILQTGYYVLRKGHYRVIYHIDENEKKVTVYTIRHAREVYNKIV